jgi:hypothetical protein
MFAFVVFFALTSLSLNAAAAVVIDFGTGLAGAGGSLSYDGADVTGTDIPIGSMIVEGTSADGTYAVTALMNFDTAADTITIDGNISDGGINITGVLLSGSFSDFTFQIIPGPGTSETEVFSATGSDTKNSDLLSALGVDPLTAFEFFVFSIESANDNVVSTDIINTAIPVPASAWLFMSGLLGLLGIARRRTV